MRWVLMTALGILVEPEVKRNLAIVSGPVAAMAASTAGVGSVASSAANEVVARPGTLPLVVTSSTSSSSVARMARLYRAARRWQTPGRASASSRTWRSLSKSWLISE